MNFTWNIEKHYHPFSIIENPFFYKIHLLKNFLTKKKPKILDERTFPWNGGYLDVSTPDKVAKTMSH